MLFPNSRRCHYNAVEVSVLTEEKEDKGDLNIPGCGVATILADSFSIIPKVAMKLR